VVTSTLNRIIATGGSDRDSLFSLNHWDQFPVVLSTLSASKESSDGISKISLDTTTITDINTKSLPRRNAGVESKFFSFNSGIFRLIDYKGQITFLDSKLLNLYCDLLVDDENISSHIDAHMGGSALFVTGSNLSVDIQRTTISHTMGAFGAIRILNLEGASSIILRDSHINHNHGLITSALHVESVVDLTLEVHSTSIKNNVLSANRVLSLTTPANTSTINFILPSGAASTTVAKNFILPSGAASTTVAKIRDCDVFDNSGSGKAIVMFLSGGSHVISECNFLRNGNTIRSKYSNSLFATIFPQKSFPKSSGVGTHFLYSNNIKDITVDDNTMDSNWTARSVGSTIGWTVDSHFGLILIKSNRVRNALGQVRLGETGEWGLLDSEDSDQNLNWVPTTEGEGDMGSIFRSLAACRSLNCNIHFIFLIIPFKNYCYLGRNLRNGPPSQVFLGVSL